MRRGWPQLPDHPTPGGRIAPPELVVRLRSIDRGAELVYIGRGKWLLGIVDDNAVRRARATRMLDSLNLLALEVVTPLGEIPKEMRAFFRLRFFKARLGLAGFRDIALYECQGEPTGRIVSDFEERDWRYRHQFREIERGFKREIEQGSDGLQVERKKEDVIRYLQLEGKDLHRTIMRRRKSITSRAKPRPKAGRVLYDDRGIVIPQRSRP